MTIQAARDALSTLAKALWDAAAPGAPLLYDNTKDQKPPQNATLWGRLHIQHDGADRVTLGAGAAALHRSRGQLFVQVFGPPATSTLVVEQTVDQLVVGFQNAGGVDSIRFASVGPKDVGPDGTFYQMNCELKFSYDRSE